MKNISVFCGAHEGNNPRFAEDARKIGEILAAKGINVVFGGGNVGLMKIVSDAALDNGVDAIGIGLESLHKLELVNPRLKNQIKLLMDTISAQAKRLEKEKNKLESKLNKLMPDICPLCDQEIKK